MFLRGVFLIFFCVFEGAEDCDKRGIGLFNAQSFLTRAIYVVRSGVRRRGAVFRFPTPLGIEHKLTEEPRPGRPC